MASYALKGQKLLAQGVWGKQGDSSELFFVPQISQINTEHSDDNGKINLCESVKSVGLKNPICGT